jgi:hypothetical protein
MAENGARPPERSSNGHQQNGHSNGHGEAPVAHQDDVFLDIPKLSVDKIEIDVANLRARVSLNAEVLSLLKLNVGVDAMVDQVHLGIQGVEAEAQLRVRLDNVAHIVDRVLTTLDNHPEIIAPLVENAGRAIGAAGQGIESAVKDTGRGAGEAVSELGGGASDATREVGRGAGEATREIGGGAGQATRSVGEGAGDATRDVGRGAGKATGDVGEGAGKATGDVGEGAGKATGDVGEGAGKATGDVGEGAGDATRDVGRGAGKATGDVGAGAGQAAGDVGEDAGEAAGDVGGGAGNAAGEAVEDVGQDAGDLGKTAKRAGKQVTEHAAEADAGGDDDEPDISAQSTVAADEETKKPARLPRRAGRGLPRRKPREW